MNTSFNKLSDNQSKPFQNILSNLKSPETILEIRNKSDFNLIDLSIATNRPLMLLKLLSNSKGPKGQLIDQYKTQGGKIEKMRLTH
jgi:hypothetical protein